MNFSALILAIAVAVAASGTVAADARQRLSVSAQAGWSAIGRVNISGLGHCTGSLVRPDLVLTAAHCLVDKRTKMVVSPQRVRFLAGFRAGSYAAVGRAAAISLVAGFGVDPKVRNDLALIWLQDPLPDGIAPLQIDPVVFPGDRLDTLSYGFDRSQILSRQSGCRILRRSASLVVTTCEGVPGVSGSPMIRLTEDGPRIVAVASSVASPRRNGVIRGNLIGVLAHHSSLSANLNEDARNAPPTGSEKAESAEPGGGETAGN